ncbi:uncharacterized protein EV154DRAFT_582204 [Mucor mucedo]|uniref:uncharacterized protein n=1 Tax=Mucor mucedo TaxID=29922 RepID=UPI00221EA52C|nr:uncharacterized protein EV154DRAFT_582204 [Mucor mucedo]KAI7868392.1 hypothetical protein EV154DRAFT_582204 [Mucor mucedo]
MPPVTKRTLLLYTHIAILSAAAFHYMNLLESGCRINKQFYTTSKSLHELAESAARKLIMARQDDAYMCHLGLTTASFDELYEEFLIEYPNVCKTGRKRVFDPEMILALVLMWLD